MESIIAIDVSKTLEEQLSLAEKEKLINLIGANLKENIIFCLNCCKPVMGSRGEYDTCEEPNAGYHYYCLDCVRKEKVETVTIDGETFVKCLICEKE